MITPDVTYPTFSALKAALHSTGFPGEASNASFHVNFSSNAGAAGQNPSSATDNGETGSHASYVKFWSSGQGNSLDFRMSDVDSSKKRSRISDTSCILEIPVSQTPANSSRTPSVDPSDIDVEFSDVESLDVRRQNEIQEGERPTKRARFDFPSVHDKK